MESSVRGAVAGGAFRGVSSPLERAPAEPTIPPVVTPEVVVDPLAGADTTEVIPEIEAAPVETETGPITTPVETETGPITTGRPVSRSGYYRNNSAGRNRNNSAGRNRSNSSRDRNRGNTNNNSRALYTRRNFKNSR